MVSFPSQIDPIQAMRPLRICMVSSEVVPFAKTGGLADVVGALAVQFARLGHEVCVVLPFYRQVESLGYQWRTYARLSVPTSAGDCPVEIQELIGPSERLLAGSGLRVFTVRHDPFFARSGLYQDGGHDYPDNLERFALFCRSVMEWLLYIGEQEHWLTDILHLHDWQAALCAVYLRALYRERAAFALTKSALTIHNLGYQGLFPGENFYLTDLPASLFAPASLEFYGSVNLLKGGLVFADLLTTVSPTYSREIQTADYGFGLDGVLKERKHVLHGVVNGIDVDFWNPATDPYLPASYSSQDLTGKAVCKVELQRELGLRRLKVPMLGVITRLAAQKGIDLIIQVIPELMELSLQMVILGTGDVTYEKQVQGLAEQYKERIAFRNIFDEGLAHRIEAASDIFVMPSRYEPCGLSQLYSLRYGTVPVVRSTGGLVDTVVPYTPRTFKDSRATGFSFTDTTVSSLLTSLLLALSVYRKKADWSSLIKTGMSQNLSWTRSASIYLQLFEQLADKTPTE
ncbi:MAG: glycogen synthase GlgA [Nitrospira sp.]|nr:MAG: glycogen synthase GlgA [Nitrospira sp.]